MGSSDTVAFRWESTVLMLSYLCRHYAQRESGKSLPSQCMQNMRVVELGAGIGVASIQAALYGKDPFLALFRHKGTDGTITLLPLGKAVP